MAPNEYLSRLLELSEEKYILITELLRLTKAQGENFTEETLDNLEKFIENKQLLIDRIINLDENFEVYFSRLKSTLGIKSLDEISVDKFDKAVIMKLKTVVSDITSMTNLIIELEKENSDKAHQLKDFFAAEVRKINMSKQASTAYTPGGGYIKPPSYFVDKKK